MEDATKRLAPTFERFAEERAAVEVEEIEDEVGERRPGRAAEPDGQAVRVRSAAPVDHDELSVEDRGASGDVRADRREVGGDRREVPTATIEEANVPLPAGRGLVVGLDERERSLTAPRGLEQVVVRIERRLDRAREHRSDRDRQSRQAWFETQRELVGHLWARW
jgi:hypothetical protein